MFKEDIIMSEEKICPGCGRHCDLSEPHCGTGVEYAKAEGITIENARDEHEGHRHEGCGHKRCEDRFKQYDELDIDDKLILTLRHVGHTIRFLFEGKGSQNRVLIILNESGSMTQKELTERMGVQPGSASEVIGKLESAGLIVRKPNPTDRRTVEVELTEEGKANADAARAARELRHKEMFSCLSDSEKETLLSLAEKLKSDWDSRYTGEEMRGKGCHSKKHHHHGEH